MSLEQIKNRVLRLGGHPRGNSAAHNSDTDQEQLTNGIVLPHLDSASRLIVPSHDPAHILLPDSLTPDTSHSMEVLIPTEEDFRELNTTLRAENLEKELETVEYKKKITIFTASPFGFFDQRLAQQKVPSPIKDFYKQIRVFREQPHDPDNPLAQADAKLPDTAIVNVLETRFIKKTISNPERKKELLYGLGSAIGTAITELTIEDGLLSLNQELISTLLHSMELVLISYLYKTGTHKLNDPELLELVITKLFYLTEQDMFTLQGKEKKHALHAVFDFLAHFELNTVEACKFVLRVSRIHSVSHPLEYEAEYFLQNEGIHESFLAEFGYDSYVRDLYGSDPISHKVGMEIEGVPLVIHGEFPGGFTPGVDGGATMPEIRRDSTDLDFTSRYRKQMYDMWYLAKVTQLKGASVHLHFDDPNNDWFYHFFSQVVNPTWNTIRQSAKFRTVELRFNLSSYNQPTGNLDFTSPVVEDQYHIVPVIEYILQSMYRGDWQEIPEDLSSHWSVAVKKIRPRTYDTKLSFELALDILRNSDELKHGNFSLQSEFYSDFLDLMPRVFHPDQAMLLAREAGYNEDFVLLVLERLVGTLSCKDLLELYTYTIGARHEIKGNFIGLVKEPVTEEDLKLITEKLDNSSIVVERLRKNNRRVESFFELRKDLALHSGSIDRKEYFENLFENRCNLEFTISELEHLFEAYGTTVIGDSALLFFQRLKEEITNEALVYLFEMMNYAPNIVIAGLSVYDGNLPAEVALEIFEYLTEEPEVIKALSEKIDPGAISVEMLLELINANNFDSYIANGSLRLLGGLSITEYTLLKSMLATFETRPYRRIIYFLQLQMIPYQNRTPAILLRDFLQ